MTMTFSLQENLDFSNIETRSEHSLSPEIPIDDVHIFSEKIEIPKFANVTSRPRLTELLEKNFEQFSATIITGRAGTGKTALASEFSRKYERVAWYSVAGSDCDWKVFSSYFQAGFKDSRLTIKGGENIEINESVIVQYLENLFSRLNVTGTKKPLLIVLDDLHHIYDCAWFADFFNHLLGFLTPDTHLLLLARSQPPVPLWRLRSKQILGVVDEKLLALTCDETIEIFALNKMSARAARKFHRENFGRMSKLSFAK